MASKVAVAAADAAPHRSTLDEAEPYGEFITHAAGHYERWQEWQELVVRI